ncbi:protein phosphatase 2C [Cryptosporidium andersoni]|uniref:Protein phosphatase 2C n=1 Tax=Cryptosporidium andersoni TaxID=117008 RepID=A0A1J4MRT1_9CRYT|nr:protein phosphatase 2C [Cryptosporidium andersoni]
MKFRILPSSSSSRDSTPNISDIQTLSSLKRYLIENIYKLEENLPLRASVTITKADDVEESDDNSEDSKESDYENESKNFNSLDSISKQINKSTINTEGVKSKDLVSKQLEYSYKSSKYNISYDTKNKEDDKSTIEISKCQQKLLNNSGLPEDSTKKEKDNLLNLSLTHLGSKILDNLGEVITEGAEQVKHFIKRPYTCTGSEKKLNKTLSYNVVYNIVQEFYNREMNKTIKEMLNFTDNNNIREPKKKWNDNRKYEAFLENPFTAISCWEDLGMRHDMRDGWFISNIKDGTFLGVFDGHGDSGSISSELEDILPEEFYNALVNPSEKEYLNREKSNKLSSHFPKDPIIEALLKAFIIADHRILMSSKSLNCGSSACCCYIVRFEYDKEHSNIPLENTLENIHFKKYIYKLYCSKVGNTRAVLCRSGTPINLSKAKLLENDLQTNSSKQQSIYDLPIVSSFGYGMYKPPKESNYIITNVPDVFSIELCTEDEFLIIASQSIWEVLDENQAVLLIKSILDSLISGYPNLKRKIISNTLAQCIVTEALLRGVTDNLTCIVGLFV